MLTCFPWCAVLADLSVSLVMWVFDTTGLCGIVAAPHVICVIISYSQIAAEELLVGMWGPCGPL